jgi:hypothetical protein
VAVFGSSDPEDSSADYALARAVGRVLAEQGYGIVNGGYGGTMEAGARGAHEAGGLAIGVPCSIWSSRPRAQFLTDIRMTHSYPERLQTIIELGTAGYVVLPGGSGTLVEVAWVWEQAAKGWVADRPIVCMTDFWRPLVEMMDRARPGTARFVHIASTAEDLRNVFVKIES